MLMSRDPVMLLDDTLQYSTISYRDVVKELDVPLLILCLHHWYRWYYLTASHFYNVLFQLPSSDINRYTLRVLRWGRCHLESALTRTAVRS